MSQKRTVIGLGEVLWDLFPDFKRPGGAPANVAFQANQLGNRGLVASRVGQDDLGRELRDELEQSGLDLSLLQTDPAHPTGRVTVDLTDGGHPEYIIHEDVAWDYLEPAPHLLDAAREAAAICFGTLAQRNEISREAIHRVLQASGKECLIVYDVNIRQEWYQAEWIERSLRVANVVKLNRDEADLLAPMLGLIGSDFVAFARSAIRAYDLELVCITRAEEGCLLVSPTETVDVGGKHIEVADAVGAGDAFTAALITARLNGWPLGPAGRFANDVGGLVASHSGAMPPLEDELGQLFQHHTPH